MTYIKTLIISGAYYAFSLTQIETTVKIVVGLVTAGYMIWKWYSEYKKNE